MNHTDKAAQDAMGNLYALNRMNDLLLMSFQREAGEAKIAPVSLDEYVAWFSDIGFTVTESQLAELARNFRKRGVAFFGVDANQQDGPVAIGRFAERHGLPSRS
jgi:hypothetical protein